MTDTEMLEKFLVYVKQVVKIVKPWKVRPTMNTEEASQYAEGWNDCIKQMQKQADNYYKYMFELK